MEGVADWMCFILRLSLHEFSRRGNDTHPRRFMMLATWMKHFYTTFYCFASNFPLLVNADQTKNALKACVHQAGEKNEDEQASCC